MATTQHNAHRTKDAVMPDELRRKLFLERMERKLAFKEAIYNKLYRRRRPFTPLKLRDPAAAELREIPSE